MVGRWSRHHVCAPRSQPNGTTVVLVPVEWQLNIDPSMLRNFQHRVQQALAGPGLYPPQFPLIPLNAVHAPGASKSIAEPELELALLEVRPPYYIFPDINHFLAGPNSGHHDSNSSWTVDATHPGSSHSRPAYPRATTYYRCRGDRSHSSEHCRDSKPRLLPRSKNDRVA